MPSGLPGGVRYPLPAPPITQPPHSSALPCFPPAHLRTPRPGTPGIRPVGQQEGGKGLRPCRWRLRRSTHPPGSWLLRAWLSLVSRFTFILFNSHGTTNDFTVLPSGRGRWRVEGGSDGQSFPLPGCARSGALPSESRRRASVSHLGRQGRGTAMPCRVQGVATPLRRSPLHAFSASTVVGSRSSAIAPDPQNRAPVAPASRQAHATSGRIEGSVQWGAR